MSESGAKKPRILYVDDEKENLLNFKYLFREWYEIHLALSAKEGYEILKHHDIQVVIADQRMPSETGVQFLERIIPEYPNITRMIVTGYSDINAVITAINKCRIYYYFQKPWNENEMKIVIDSAVEAYHSKKRQDKGQGDLGQIEHELRSEIEALRKQIDEKTNLLREIRESGEQLRLSEERLRTIFETAQDGIFLKDRALRYTHVNSSMAKVFQIQPDHILGRTDEDFLGERLASDFRSLEFRVLKGQSIEAEHTVMINGSPLVLSITRTPFKDSLGNIVGLCGIVRDITDRKPMNYSRELDKDIYKSDAMKSTLRQIMLAAQNDSTVLFLGESGSGKDFLAKYLHDKSHRSGCPFFSINCAALAPELVDSELFGHEPGAFTGCRGRKRGLLELAEGGTLLLNEIGELSLNIQAKLLSFLDTKSFTRVGGEQPILVNARLIAATNKDLEKEVEKGKFRSDLFYRLNVFPIRVPPLRERLEDLPALVEHLLTSIAKRLGLNTRPKIEPNVMDALLNYTWPGNVRELENLLERALILSDKKTITKEDLALPENNRTSKKSYLEANLTASLADGLTLNEMLDKAKHFLISESLRKCGGNVTKAASLLGISRGSLKHYIKRLNISKGEQI